MSSTLRSPSQIPVRSKFLISLTSNIPRVPGSASLYPAFTLDNWPGSISLAADIDAVGVPYFFDAGDLFRDLGRQIMIVDAAGAHVALYREAMPQNNGEAEGIATIGGSVWLRVWAADGSAVEVVRLG